MHIKPYSSLPSLLLLIFSLSLFRPPFCLFPCVSSLSPSHDILFSTLLFLAYLFSPSLPLFFPYASHSLISSSPPSTPYVPFPSFSFVALSLFVFPCSPTQFMVPLFLSFHSPLILYPFFSFTKYFFLSFFLFLSFCLSFFLPHTTHLADDNLCIPQPTVKSFL